MNINSNNFETKSPQTENRDLQGVSSIDVDKLLCDKPTHHWTFLQPLNWQKIKIKYYPMSRLGIDPLDVVCRKFRIKIKFYIKRTLREYPSTCGHKKAKPDLVQLF